MLSSPDMELSSNDSYAYQGTVERRFKKEKSIHSVVVDDIQEQATFLTHRQGWPLGSICGSRFQSSLVVAWPAAIRLLETAVEGSWWCSLGLLFPPCSYSDKRWPASNIWHSAISSTRPIFLWWPTCLQKWINLNVLFGEKLLLITIFDKPISHLRTIPKICLHIDFQFTFVSQSSKT